MRLAFLEFMTPDLASAASALVAQGCTRIAVLPLFLGSGGHVRKDLPALLDALRAQHTAVAFDLHPAVGEAPAMIATLADIALGLEPLP